MGREGGGGGGAGESRTGIIHTHVYIYMYIFVCIYTDTEFIHMGLGSAYFRTAMGIHSLVPSKSPSTSRVHAVILEAKMQGTTCQIW